MTNEELDAELVRLAGAEREGLRRFLERLAEFDEQKGAEGRAYPSLYVYCRARLKLSEGESYRRIHAARAARRCPLILDRIEDGAVNLSVVSVLAPLLTPLNQRMLLDRAAHKTKREVEFMVCELEPKPIPRDVIRSVVPAPVAAGAADPAQADGCKIDLRATQDVEVVSGEFVRLHISAPRDVLDKLERASDLLRHKFPFADYAQIIGLALDRLLERADPDQKRLLAAPKPVGRSGNRRIPQWVKDEVWKRDSGRCAFRSSDDRRCGETAWLEFDHLKPFALGGRSDDPANVRLLCRAHNQHAAKELFGADAVGGKS